ncbi:MAG: hypothetical protein GX039_04415 [Clostridia bacterium]|nr:hypothetical protein [Clostridia bacterium]
MGRGKLQDARVDELFQAVLALENLDECYSFFEDLCTTSEIKAMAQRLAVARLLRQGVTYNDIAAATGASTATISRVKRFLHYGADGYNLILDRLEAKAGKKD